MACRLPKGIDSPEKFWTALLRGDDLITEIPADRWDADEYYDPEPGVPDHSVSRWGGFLDDVAGFDPEFFGISEREAIAIDPQHRLLLQTSWEAVEHAGMPPMSLSGSLTGVFVGMCHDDYAFVTDDAGALGDAYAFTGTAFSMASGRVSYALGLRGPAMTVDTACSSSLLAVHMACRSLDGGESDLALAGGCMLMLEPDVFSSASAQGMLSPTGRCRTFDASADGFVRSEGCAMLVLKRLPDAVRDGDRVLAVLRGTATNQDGRTDNISTPSPDAQVAAYRAALAVAGVDADTVGMVEAHGTGTPVGDPIEFSSLAQVYGSNGNPCAVGSAKSSVGHTEAAAGAVGIIKAVLSLQHGLVPPMVHHTRLPDELAEIDSALFVPQAITPWPEGNGRTPRRAAVSSYGMSGSNVHVILEQAPEPAVYRNGAAGLGDALLFTVSASSTEALRQTADRLADWIDNHEVSPSDLAYTLARRRSHQPVRAGLIAGDRTELAHRLREAAAGDTPYPAAVGRDDLGPVWVFSGQGSQWATMGASLLANEPVFAATVAELEPLIAAESGFSVTEAMTAMETVTGIDRVQPTLFAIQVALAQAMRSYGVHPGAVIGHSLGEVAAAVVAGALSLADGVKVICRRSRLCTRLAGSGAMASVELPAARVREDLVRHRAKDVVVAVVASPQSTVIGGATDTVRELVAAWEQREVMAREVAVDVASHSPQVDPILDDLYDVLADLEPLTPEVPYYSATLFDPREEPYCDGSYWVDNLRHTVRFGAAVQAALEDGYRVFAELAPHPLLTRAVEKTAEGLDMPVAALAGMRREQPLPHGLRGLLADLHSAGAAVDFSVLYPAGELVDAPLPAWTHQSLLLNRAGQDHQAQGGSSVVVHPLLGSHVLLPEEPERHVWQSDVGTEALPWLADHQIHSAPALPGAAYCEMALVAARTILGDAAEVRDVRFEQMLLLDDETPLSAVGSVKSPGIVDFVVETFQDGGAVRRGGAVLHAVEDDDQLPAYDIPALLAEHSRTEDGEELRARFDEHGVQYGPAFTGLGNAHIADGAVSSVVAEVALPGAMRSQQRAYAIHPALLDACFQAVGAHPDVQVAGNGGLMLPLGVRQIRAYASTRNAHYCYARVTSVDTSAVEADLDVLDEHGTVLVAVRGLQLGTGVSEEGNRDRVLNERLLTIEWQQRELPEVDAAEAGAWLLISTSDGADMLAAELTDALKLHSAQCATTSWHENAADHAASAERLRNQLNAGGFHNAVILLKPDSGDRDENSGVEGVECVRHVVRVVREL
ncbi:acyltransferase domain-containing protein, partial [Mycobacterium marinum]|uniref:acyltransferase domain-containing protein n=1 Tax=Mycobacterium marinum TaxID=1781 RepID=UPI0035696828